MNRYLILSLLVASFTIVGCKKEVTEPTNNVFQDNCDTTLVEFHSNDTVFPSDYIMAYPGSWWEYSDGSIATSDEWRLKEVVTTTKPDCYVQISDYHYLPNFNNYWIDNNFLITSNDDDTFISSSQLTGTSLGEVFYSVVSNEDGPYFTKHTKSYVDHLDSLEVLGVMYYDVMVIGTRVANHKGGVILSTSHEDEKFYSKNIGLIRQTRVTMGWDYDTLDLVNYHIEPY